MTQTTTAGRQELTHTGQTITHRAGAVVIALTWIRDGVYRVTINTPSPVGALGFEVDGMSYPDEATARTEARRMAHAYAAGDSTQQLADRHGALLDLAETWTKRRGPDAARRAANFRRQADAIQPLAGRAQDDDLAARLTADLAARLTADLAAHDTDARYTAASTGQLSGLGRLKAAHAAAMNAA